MKRLPVGAVLGSLVLCSALPSSSYCVTTVEEAAVWQWFDGCAPDQVMQVEVLLGERALLAEACPVCLMTRRDIPADRPQKQLVFSFNADAAIFGAEFSALGKTQIEGAVWRAGGDPADILLGASFMTKDRILLNTIHIALPDKPSRSVLTDGLVIRTSAVQPAEKRRKPKQ